MAMNEEQLYNLFIHHRSDELVDMALKQGFLTQDEIGEDVNPVELLWQKAMAEIQDDIMKPIDRSDQKGEADRRRRAEIIARLFLTQHKYEAEARFRNTYAEEINSHDGHFWRFPYTELSETLLAEQWPNPYVDAGRISDIVGEDRCNDLMSASQNIGVHFRRVLETIEADGRLTNDRGETVIVIDQNEGVRITPIVSALFDDGFGEYDIFGEYEPALLSSDQEEEQQVVESPDTYEWFIKRGEWKEVDILTLEERTQSGYMLTWGQPGEGKTTMPYELDENARSLMYLSLYALVSLLDCKNVVYQILYPMKRERKHSKLRTETSLSPNDAVTNGLFNRDKNMVTADKYNCGLDNSITISTGKDTSVQLTIVNEQPPTSRTETYQLSPDDRFWYETVVSINYNDGKEPITVIRGSDLLSFNGYSNPYQENARDIIREAFRCIHKMSSILQVAIDTTEERKRYENVAESYKLQPIIDASISLMRFEDNAVDFEIELDTTHGKEAYAALPLAKYASDKGQVVVMTRSDMEFKTVKKLRLEHRKMWRYVWRRACEQKTSSTIVFDTLFRDINLEDMDRFKRGRMITTLRKMLQERRDQGRLTFKVNRKGNREYSVTVKRIDSIKDICEG